MSPRALDKYHSMLVACVKRYSNIKQPGFPYGYLLSRLETKQITTKEFLRLENRLKTLTRLHASSIR